MSSLPALLHGLGGMAMVVIVTCLVFSAPARADISITLPNNDTFQYSSANADFGPAFPSNGLLIHHIKIADPPFGCKKEDHKPPEMYAPWASLVRRGECSFVEKVINAQRMGASAVIVADTEPGRLIIMDARVNTDDVTTPSMFVQKSTGDFVESRAGDSTILLTNSYDLQTPWPNFLLPFVIVFVVAIVMLTFWVVYRRNRRISEARESRLSVSAVSKLPTRKFVAPGSMTAASMGDGVAVEDGMEEPDSCSICLEDYATGDELRQLPCGHEFHSMCIDPWLTMRKRTCPLCKHVASEKTPLLENHNVRGSSAAAAQRCSYGSRGRSRTSQSNLGEGAEPERSLVPSPSQPRIESPASGAAEATPDITPYRLAPSIEGGDAALGVGRERVVGAEDRAA